MPQCVMYVQAKQQQHRKWWWLGKDSKRATVLRFISTHVHSTTTLARVRVRCLQFIIFSVVHDDAYVDHRLLHVSRIETRTYADVPRVAVYLEAFDWVLLFVCAPHTRHST